MVAILNYYYLTQWAWSDSDNCHMATIEALKVSTSCTMSTIKTLFSNCTEYFKKQMKN